MTNRWRTHVTGALQKLCVALVSAVIGAVSFDVIIQPTQSLNDTQAVVMQEYLNAFCKRDDQHDKNFIIGQAAAMSRIVVRANLGNLALLEYAKCRAGL